MAPHPKFRRHHSWTNTGNFGTLLVGHTDTLLSNGFVLVAGGGLGSFGQLTSTELFDSTTGTWTNTGSLNTARQNHTAKAINRLTPTTGYTPSRP
jgi:Galactose oxidase, central domain